MLYKRKSQAITNSQPQTQIFIKLQVWVTNSMGKFKSKINDSSLHLKSMCIMKSSYKRTKPFVKMNHQNILTLDTNSTKRSYWKVYKRFRVSYTNSTTDVYNWKNLFPLGIHKLSNMTSKTHDLNVSPYSIFTRHRSFTKRIITSTRYFYWIALSTSRIILTSTH